MLPLYDEIVAVVARNIPVSCVKLLIVLPCVRRAKEVVVLRVLACTVDVNTVPIYALPEERVLVKNRDVLKFTIAVDGKEPMADEREERPIARVEKFQPAWVLSVEE